MSAIEQLTKLCAQDDAVIFVGSGISRWAGLPSWEGVIERLADFLDANNIDSTLTRLEGREGGLLQAASYGMAKLTKAQFGQFVRGISGTGTATPVSIHESLMRMGPSCFITTNYDDLIEQAFRRWRDAPSEPQVVLNRQLVEQADISQTQARAFIFKTHGDARDVDTVILSHEQYRRLMPGGELHATLTTLTTLLVSRPVLFVGFGLRDPDFLFLRDLLANAYRGGVRDHYAMVADPLAEQVDWYRNHLGIHLIGYETRERSDGGRDHDALAELLAAAGRAAVTAAPVTPAIDLSDPARVLELARYGASSIAAPEGERFVIRVRSTREAEKASVYRPEPYQSWDADRLLREGPNRLVLTGAPGAGKSFAIAYEVSRLGEALQDACLRGALTDTTCVAIGLDLKLYAGDLVAQIDALLPPNVHLDILSAAVPVRLFIDSFNEAPRIYRENGVLDADLDRLLGNYPHIGVVIGSRTADGLERLSLPIFDLSEIEEAEVLRHLGENSHSIPEAHRDEIVRILQRPFYFRLARRSTISLRDVHGPSDLYRQYLNHVIERFRENFSGSIRLEAMLEQQGYLALEEGAEAFSISGLKAALLAGPPTIEASTAEAVINWLVANELLIPLGNGRASFVHQSVTEYLAARKLLARLKDDDDTVSDIILQRRWDNVIFLALGMIDGDAARSLLQRIVKADLVFAITGARYVEHKRDTLLTMLLEALMSAPLQRNFYMVDHIFERLQFSHVHEALLRQITERGGALGSSAIIVLGRLLGVAYKPDLIGMLFAKDMSWSQQRAMQALAPLITADDVASIVTSMLEKDPNQLGSEDMESLTNGVSHALSGVQQDLIESEIYSRIDAVDDAHARMLSGLLVNMLFNAPQPPPLTMFVNLYRRRLLSDSYALYNFIVRDEIKSGELLKILDDPLLEALIEGIAIGDTWALSVLRILCEAEPQVAKRALAITPPASDDLRTLITFSISKDDATLFAWLERVVSLPAPFVLPKSMEAVRFNELDWRGRHDLLVTLLRRQDIKLSATLLGHMMPFEINGLPKIDLGEPEPWINWLTELGRMGRDGDSDTTFVEDQIAFLCARSSNPKNRDGLLNMLESNDSSVVWTVGRSVLPWIEGLTLAELSEVASNNLLMLLREGDFRSAFRPHSFAEIADEAFVRDVLLPLAACGDKQLRANVATVSEAAGRRLGIRFVLPEEAHNY